jgi:putative transport protein
MFPMSMPAFITNVFTSAPEIAIFLSLGLGYLLGQIKFGSFSLGATAGTLMVAIVIGVLFPELNPPGLLKAIFFALFIYAVGFKTGPQFFKSFDRRMIKQIVLTLVVTVTGLLCVIVAAKVLKFDAGMAAGLGAGGLTQSAIIGTAGDAIGRLKLDDAQTKALQSNVAIGYAVTYVFGTIGIIFLARDIAPRILGINLKAASAEYERNQSGGGAGLKPGQFKLNLLRDVRAFRVGERAAGTTIEKLEREIDGRCFVEFLRRADKEVEVEPATVLAKDDLVLIAGQVAGLMSAAKVAGLDEVTNTFTNVGDALDAVVTSRDVIGKSIKDLDTAAARGVFLRKVVRGGTEVPVTGDFILQRGDTLTLVGASKDVMRVGKGVGTLGRPSEKTDLLYCGVGIVLGTLIGLISIPIAGIPVTLGAGGGVLVAGLVFGWLRSLHPTFGNFPSAVQQVFSDLGLNGFIAVVGLIAGPNAWNALKTTGVGLFVAGVCVTLIPAFVGLFLGKMMKMDPIVLIGAICGARSANAAIGAVTDAAESSAPAVGFTVPYAIANVLLTVWGPVIVGIMR